MNLKLRFATLAVLGGISITLLSGVAFAQLPTASITGTVQDSSGAAIPSATVTATSEETALTRTAQTESDGHYVLLALPIGVYDVKAEAPSFGTVVQQKLTLTVSQQAVINFTMNVGSVSQEVSVTAEAPLVETTNGTLGGLVNEERVADLPLNGRNFTDLTLMQAGISQNYHPNASGGPVTTGTDFSSNGAGMHSNFITLDGANMLQGNGYNGGSILGTQLGVEGIREFLVVTNSFKAEYGMVSGSHTVVATKGGTNQFHGTAFDYFRNSGLDARGFFDPQKKPVFHRNNFGGSFGGPVKKNKAFFFVTYEAIRQHQGVTSLLNTITAGARQPGFFPTAPAGPVPAILPYLALFPLPNAGCLSTDPTGVPNDPTAVHGCTGGVGRLNQVFNIPTSEDYVQGRADYNFSDKDSFFARYTIDTANQTSALSTYSLWPAVLYGRSQYLTLAENHIFSTSLLNTFRLSYSRPYQDFEAPAAPGTDGLAFAPGLPLGGVSPGSGITSIGPVSSNPYFTLQNLFTLSDDLSWTHGAHTFKFGTLMNHYEVWGESGSSWRGIYSFASLGTCATGTPPVPASCFINGTASQFIIVTPGSLLDRKYRWMTFGFYAQDDWRVTSRFTLNLGLRYEFNTNVNEANNRKWAIRHVQSDGVADFVLNGPFYNNPSLHNFGPRVGFAWDIFGNNKTSLRGGFGYLYDITTLPDTGIIIDTGQPPYSSTSTVLSGLTFPHTVIPASAVGNTLRGVDWNMHQPSTMQYNLTLERSLPGDMSLALSYAGSRSIHVIQTNDANPAAPTIINGQHYWSGIVPPVPATACMPGVAFSAGDPNPRPNCHFQSIEFRSGGGESWYSGLQVVFQKRMSHGLQFQTTYTWSHCLDTVQGQVAGDGAGSTFQNTDPTRPLLDKGNCDWDIPHVFVFNTLYNLPNPIASGWGHTVLGGWRVGSIVTLKTGQPFTVYNSGNASRSLIGNYNGLSTDRPNFVPGAAGCNGNVILNNPNRDYNPACFAPQQLVTAAGATGCTIAANTICYGTLGNEGRNMFFSPWLRNWDFSLTKDTPVHFLGEAGAIEFRTEIFNVLNHPGFYIPNKTVFTYTNTATSTPVVTNPGVIPTTAGQITQTVDLSREIQFALKFIF